MTALALIMVIGSAVLHAVWNYLSKKANGGTSFMWLFTAIASVVYLPVFISVIYYIDFTFTPTIFLFIGGSIVLHLVYFLLLFQGYKVGDLSIVYPVSRGFAPMVSTFLAIYIFNESPTVITFTGIMCIIIGIFFLTGGMKVFKSKENLVPASYGVIIGLTIASYTLLDKAAVSLVLISPIILDYFNTVGRLAFLTPLALRNWKDVKDQWVVNKKEAFGVAVLNSLGYILVLTALQFTPVSYVAPLREISIFFGTLIGVKWLAEGFGIQRVISSVIIVAGVMIIAFTTL